MDPRQRCGWLGLAVAGLLFAGCGTPRGVSPYVPPGGPVPQAAAKPRKPPTLRGPRGAKSAHTHAAQSTLPAGVFQPVAVIVENAPDARPQSGLDQASIVWEFLAEGGITRFFCIFTHPADRIGPVRSTRIYFDRLDRAYGLPLAHAGGNRDAMNYVGTWHLQNLDEIYNAGPYFWRSSDRLPPHNLYTSTTLLEHAIKAYGYHSRPVIQPAAGAAPTGGAPTSSVNLMYAYDPPVYVYEAGWEWSDGSWVRTVNGQVQVMTDGHEVHAGTVIILVVPYAPDPDPTTVGAIKMLWGHPGPAWVLRDGRRYEGTWAMGSDGLPLVGVDGRALHAGPGPYWYEVVPYANDVTFH